MLFACSDGSIVVAFANNLGYRLVLRERHAQPSVWEILMAEGHDVLYASDNVYGHLPPVNEWRVVMGETPEPALKEITMDEPREEPMQNDVDDWTDAQAGGKNLRSLWKQEQGATASQQCGNFASR